MLRTRVFTNDKKRDEANRPWKHASEPTNREKETRRKDREGGKSRFQAVLVFKTRGGRNQLWGSEA